MISRYRAGLAAAIRSESKAYGFTLVIWGTGALALSERGSPGTSGTFAFVGGALGAMAVVIVASYGGPTQPMGSVQLRRVAWGAIHFASIAGGLATGWGLAVVTGPRWAAYLAAGGGATLAYQLILGLEVAASTSSLIWRTDENS